MNPSSLLDAIQIVKENERLATEGYANAANKTSTLGKGLFEQLSEFERFHYERLAALEKSLQEEGGFIPYEGKEFILPPVLELKFLDEPGSKSLMHIISDAKNLEKQAQMAYADLAAQLTDPQGRDMFLKLAGEEQMHYEILSEAYWSLNETGVWKWSRIK